MNLKSFFQSKTFKRILWGIGGLIVLLFVFRAGMIVGFKKASFSYQWGENYHRNFAGPRAGFFGDFMGGDFGKDFIDAHGVFGQIIKIDGSTLVIKGANEAEKIILLKDDTAVRRLRETIKPGDLKVDDNIVVIGSPNNAGQIEAKLIRVLPASPKRERGEPPMPAGAMPIGPFPAPPTRSR